MQSLPQTLLAEREKEAAKEKLKFSAVHFYREYRGGNGFFSWTLASIGADI